MCAFNHNCSNQESPKQIGTVCLTLKDRGHRKEAMTKSKWDHMTCYYFYHLYL